MPDMPQKVKNARILAVGAAAIGIPTLFASSGNPTLTVAAVICFVVGTSALAYVYWWWFKNNKPE